MIQVLQWTYSLISLLNVISRSQLIKIRVYYLLIKNKTFKARERFPSVHTLPDSYLFLVIILFVLLVDILCHMA